MDTGNQDAKVKRCRKCGDTVPSGKDLCWCCEHAPKLHPMEEHGCDHDSCEIDFSKKGG